MIVSHSYKFVIVGPPKTASTTLHQWLIAPPFCDHHYPPPAERKGQHDAPEGLDDYAMALAWRDPLDREVSLWAHSQSPRTREVEKTPELTFAEFVMDWQPSAIWFYNRPQAWWVRQMPRVDHVIRFNQLLPDVKAFLPIAAAIAGGHFLRPMPRLNATRHKPWREYYTPAIKRVVRERFSEDLWENFRAARPTCRRRARPLS